MSKSSPTNTYQGDYGIERAYKDGVFPADGHHMELLFTDSDLNHPREVRCACGRVFLVEEA